MVQALKAGRVLSPEEVATWPYATKHLMVDYDQFIIKENVVYR